MGFSERPHFFLCPRGSVAPSLLPTEIIRTILKLPKAFLQLIHPTNKNTFTGKKKKERVNLKLKPAPVSSEKPALTLSEASCPQGLW